MKTNEIRRKVLLLFVLAVGIPTLAYELLNFVQFVVVNHPTVQAWIEWIDVSVVWTASWFAIVFA